MAAVSVLGFDVISGLVKFSIRGTWVGKLVLESNDTPLAPLPATLDIGGDPFIGTIIEAAGDDANRVTVTIVGGQGGLDTEVPPLGYFATTIGLMLKDALSYGGEFLAIDSDGDILSLAVERFTRVAGTVRDSIKSLVKLAQQLGGIGAEAICWRVDRTGSVWIGRQIFLPFDIDYEVESESPHERSFTLAVETAGAQPGRIIRLHDLTDVIYEVNDTSLRATCRYGEDEERSADEQDLDRLIRLRTAHVDLFAPYAYTVVAQGADGALDLKSTDPRMPDLTHVAQRVGMTGVTVSKVLPGSAVIVQHENGDPSKAAVVGYELKAGMGLEMTHTGDVKITAPKIAAGGEEALTKNVPLMALWSALATACAPMGISVPPFVDPGTVILKGS